MIFPPRKVLILLVLDRGNTIQPFIGTKNSKMAAFVSGAVKPVDKPVFFLAILLYASAVNSIALPGGVVADMATTPC